MKIEKMEVKKVKKRIVVFLLIGLMALSFNIPVLANEVYVTQYMSEAETQEITPFTEMTRSYWRNYGGQIQFRIWSITNARWLTDWIPI